MNQRVFLVGRAGVSRPQASGLSLGILLEIGSSFVIERCQKETFLEIVAREGGFFFGCAERRPRIFQRGRNFWGSRWLRLFGF